MAISAEFDAGVLASVPKAFDLETHVRLIVVDGVTAVELRDYIPSLKRYGRGYWVPNKASAIEAVIRGLEVALDQAE